MASNPKTRFRRHIRSFAIIWTGLTLAVAAATFIAIYITYDTFDDPAGGRGALDLRDVSLPDPTDLLALDPSAATANAALLLATQVRATADAQFAALTAAAQARDAAEALTAPASTPVSGTGRSTAVATPRPLALDRFELGVQVQVSYDNMAQWMNVAANQLSVNWVKMQVRWREIEPQPDAYDWFVTDTYLPAARDHGLRVLVSVVTAPDWAREPGVDLSRTGPPADPQHYGDFVAALLRRYPGMIHAVEVWNEQNLDREWTSVNGLRAEDYVELLRIAYTAIKTVDPNVMVISGALAPTGVSDGVTAWDDFVYMDQLIAAGMLNYADCVGAHHNGINVSPAYTWDAVPNDPNAIFRGPFDNPHHSWSFRSTLQAYASKIALAGGRQKLCVTEFGWASAQGLDGYPPGFEFAADNSLEEQRDYTLLALDFMRESGAVRLAILWNLNYGAQAGWASDNDNVLYSIIGPGFIFRPVFDAVRDWNRAYEASFN
jgi:hypothetical protein